MRKKKAAAKRRDKRKRRKEAKDSELQCAGQVGDDLPLDNRPQEVLLDDDEQDQEQPVCDVVDTTRPCTDEPVMEAKDKARTLEKPEFTKLQDTTNSRQSTKEIRNNKRPSADAKNGSLKLKRPLSSTGDVSTSVNSPTLNDQYRQRSQSDGKESDLTNHSVQNKNPRQKYDELSKIVKKKSNPSNWDKVDPVNTQRTEVNTKTMSEVTQSQTVNCTKPDAKHHMKSESKPMPKKEQGEKASSAATPRKSPHSKQQLSINTAHGSNKLCSAISTDASHSVTTAKTVPPAPVKRIKEGPHVTDNSQSLSVGNDSGRVSTKGTVNSGHPQGSGRTAPNEGERDQKPGKLFDLIFTVQ